MSRLFGLQPFLAVLGLLLFLLAPSHALAAKTYSDNGDGTVTDPTTGLTWMRCAMGQTWDGAAATCTGTASSYTYDQAVALTGTVSFAGHSDWRLPNIRELQTIVDLTVYNPAIDRKVFTNMPNNHSSNYRRVRSSQIVWLTAVALVALDNLQRELFGWRAAPQVGATRKHTVVAPILLLARSFAC